MVRAAEERAHFLGLNLGVGRDQPADGRAAGLNPELAVLGEGLERLAIDVGDQVPEPIDGQDGAAERRRA